MNRTPAIPRSSPAARERLAFEELRNEPFAAAPASTGAWRDHWLAIDERDGRAPRIGAVTDHPDEWLNAIANGYGDRDTGGRVGDRGFRTGGAHLHPDRLPLRLRQGRHSLALHG